GAPGESRLDRPRLQLDRRRVRLAQPLRQLLLCRAAPARARDADARRPRDRAPRAGARADGAGMSLLARDRAALVVVDVQEAFRPYRSFEPVASASAKLLEAARILDVPRLVSEQYPKGLGHTAPEVGLQDEQAIEKTIFSAARAAGFDLRGREQVVVCGIEAHVCVSQTVHDLLDRGLEVQVPA